MYTQDQVQRFAEEFHAGVMQRLDKHLPLPPLVPAEKFTTDQHAKIFQFYAAKQNYLMKKHDPLHSNGEGYELEIQVIDETIAQLLHARENTLPGDCRAAWLPLEKRVLYTPEEKSLPILLAHELIHYYRDALVGITISEDFVHEGITLPKARLEVIEFPALLSPLIIADVLPQYATEMIYQGAHYPTMSELEQLHSVFKGQIAKTMLNNITQRINELRIIPLPGQNNSMSFSLYLSLFPERTLATFESSSLNRTPQSKQRFSSLRTDSGIRGAFNSDYAYLISMLAIETYKDQLRATWPQVLKSSYAEIDDTYILPVQRKVEGMRKLGFMNWIEEALARRKFRKLSRAVP
ncbi:MAG: hypothetical protein V1725_02745 [archaeon]